MLGPVFVGGLAGALARKKLRLPKKQADRVGAIVQEAAAPFL